MIASKPRNPSRGSPTRKGARRAAGGSRRVHTRGGRVCAVHLSGRGAWQVSGKLILVRMWRCRNRQVPMARDHVRLRESHLFGCTVPGCSNLCVVCSGMTLALSINGERAVGPRYAMATTNLTRRESQILELIGSGSSTKDIARALQISVWTVASHRKRICEKLGVHTTAELVALSSAKAKEGSFDSGRPHDRCHLTVEFGTRSGRVFLKSFLRNGFCASSLTRAMLCKGIPPERASC